MKLVPIEYEVTSIEKDTNNNNNDISTVEKVTPIPQIENLKNNVKTPNKEKNNSEKKIILFAPRKIFKKNKVKSAKRKVVKRKINWIEASDSE